MKARISTLARKVEELEGKQLHEVQVTGRKRGVLKCMPMCASARVAPSNIVYL